MGVEAARRALAAPSTARPAEDLFFSTPAPAYLDKTNATAIHAALGLPEWAGAYDVVGIGAVGRRRPAVGPARPSPTASGRWPSCPTCGPVWPGGPRSGTAVTAPWPSCSAREQTGTVAAELVAHAATSAEFLDRWRTPGEADSQVWEERFGQEVYVPLVEAAAADALKRAGVVAADVDHLVLSGLHARAVQAVGRRARGPARAPPWPTGRRRSATWVRRSPACCWPTLLERAEPGELIAVVVVADGADVVFRATDDLPAVRRARRRPGLADGGRAAAPAGTTCPTPGS